VGSRWVAIRAALSVTSGAVVSCRSLRTPRDPDPMLPYDCHEHNYGMVNILKAARAAEKK
jgi:hypothetical protein